MKNPKTSIIVPVYNVENVIERCIKSLIKQTQKNIEIIFIDDFSLDNSKKIIQKYAQKDKRIIYIKHKKNSGLSSARNTGLKNATGKYILFVDSDDYVREDMVEILTKEIEKGYNVVICNAYKIQNKNRKKIINEVQLKNKKQNIKTFVNTNNLGLHVVWNKIYRKDFLLKNNIIFNHELTCLEDELFSLNILLNTDNITFIDEALYFYDVRSNKNSITNGFKKTNLISGENFISHLKEKMDKYPNLITYSDVEKIRKNTLFGLLLKETTLTGTVKETKNYFEEFKKNKGKLSKRQLFALNFISVSPSIFSKFIKIYNGL